MQSDVMHQESGKSEATRMVGLMTNLLSHKIKRGNV